MTPRVHKRHLELRCLSDLTSLDDFELGDLEQEYAGGPIQRVVDRARATTHPLLHHFFVARDHKQLVGFFCLREGLARPDWAFDDTISLHHMRISKQFQGMGYGARTLGLAADWIYRNRPNVHTLILSVNSENLNARRFYERCGFEQSGTIRDGRLGPELVMTGSIGELTRIEWPAAM
ncbi:GNAT family N-acetyltransferase [Oryzicola mucosus]|uniref:GNAT family N-acetyltransferase n=1 Tax=Oryzicola mucosus TaxID=2767425 RepID=A0A8J6PYI2_9HYPH|nr:GNAT family N-acetyltransferase [Oryzicola mucosus]MBD0416828.1 GNAT family N-acetyltransferase [Oryzicola mucosus]